MNTARLKLRLWTEEDLAPFAAMNADPVVMEYFPSVLTREESDAVAMRIRAHFDERGYGLWAVEVEGGSPFVGFVGLMAPSFQAHFTPCVEVGWRLDRAHWGHGYATEAAREALRFGFLEVGLTEIVSMTTPANVRSRRVMERLGMTRDPQDDFDHPRVPPESPLRRHVLYRLRRETFDSAR
jgi:RimJ/RimL family protein N-acetyltransferase